MYTSQLLWFLTAKNDRNLQLKKKQHKNKIGINLTKSVHDPYTENCKTQMNQRAK